MPAKLKFGTQGTCIHCQQPVVWERGDKHWLTSKWTHVAQVAEGQHCAVEFQETPENPWNWLDADPLEYCTVQTGSEDPPYGPCNLKATNDEFNKCGVHAKKDVEYQRRLMEQDRREDFRNYTRETLEPILKELRELGIEVDHATSYRPDGWLRIRADQLLGLLNVYTEHTLADF